MSRRDVVTFLTAPARSGKSFNEVRRIVDDVLPMEKGTVFTNLPLNPERIAKYCAEKHKLDYQETLDRIHIIPREVEERWKNAGTTVYNDAGYKVGKHESVGPWSYFADKPLAGGTIIIDEIHNFCGSIGTPSEIANLWQKWLGELGHNQAIFRCLSQAPEKVHKCIKQEAQAWYVIRNTGLDRDPYFRIEIYDWMELYAGMFGGANYSIFVFEQESKKAEGRREAGTRQMHLMGPPYFDFYNSFNAPIAHAQTLNVKPFEHEWERHLRKGTLRGRVSLLWWFYRKNWQQLSFAAVKYLGILLLVLGFLSGRVPIFLERIVSGAFMHAFQAPVTPPGKTDATTKIPDAAAARKAPALPAVPLTPAAADPRATASQMTMPPLTLSSNGNIGAISNTRPAPPPVPPPSANPIVLMTHYAITLKHGQTFHIGQRITSGTHAGHVLTAIDWQNRSVTLENNDVLTLGD